MGDDDARRWSDAFAGIAWRLHPPSAVEDLSIRVQSEILTKAQRQQALDAIAFVHTRGAATAMLTIAQLDTPLKSNAVWWLMNRMNNDWKEYDLLTEMKTRGIYDPAKVVIQEVLIPEPDEAQKSALTVESVLALTGDAERGKVTATRCIMCHEIGGTGVQFGPALDGWGKGQTLEVIARSIIDPSADISHGFDGTELVTKDGKTIHGLLIQDGNPAIITGMGGITQMIPRGKIEAKKKMTRSLMLSGAQLGLTVQDVADLVAYLKAN
jgi:putative heme-binding domain-containing protein